MSLKPTPIPSVPEETARVARAAFPKGNPYLTLKWLQVLPIELRYYLI